MLKLSRNIYIMAAVMGLSLSCSPLMVFIGGLLATHIAPTPNLATFPLAIMIIGTALGTILAAFAMQQFGRKLGMFLGGCLALFGIFVGCWATIKGDFYGFLVAAFCLGVNVAFLQQGRFAIIESARSKEEAAKGLSLAIFVGLIAAILGTEIGQMGKNLIASPYGYAGSFVLLGVIQILSMLLLLLFNNPVMGKLEDQKGEPKKERRPLSIIVKQPIFVMSASCAAIAYALVTLVATAAPISMHEFYNHSLLSVKWVLQSHLIAMFLPSVFTGMLLHRFNKVSMLIAGLIVCVIASFIALLGNAIAYYWCALVLLGLGWNILFITSTSLLSGAYKDEEQFKVQAINDFIIFGLQALASFAAGWLLFEVGWSGIIWVCLVVAVLVMVPLLLYRRLA